MRNVSPKKRAKKLPIDRVFSRAGENPYEAISWDQRRAEIEAELSLYRNVFRTAEHFGIEELIDPRRTREYIGRFLENAYNSIAAKVDLKAKAGVRP